MHIGFANLYRMAVTTNDNISNWEREVKTMHIGFVNVCMVVAIDDSITSKARKGKKYCANRLYSICTWHVHQSFANFKTIMKKKTFHFIY